jgi:uncharacterized protein (TIGR02058 family)
MNQKRMNQVGKRVILEMGSGNDLHGGDYTKAAIRAVEDALHHSSLTMIRSLKIDPKTMMTVNVTIGVQKPEAVDQDRVKAALPVGQINVTAVKGGLDVPDDVIGDVAVIASAAVEVRFELP